MVRQILDVFLSSTALDLESHRAAVYRELISTGLFHCTRQEDFGAQDARAVDFCRDKVKASDIFIGLVGQRRGWEPDGDNARRSITEMEHDWAKEAGCRRYLYVLPDNFPVAANLRDSDETYARQQEFRKRVMAGGERIVSQKGFEEPETLAADIIKHLLTQIVTGDLITQLRPDLSAQHPVSPEEQRPAIAAAVERLADDSDVDLLALAKEPKDVDLADLELKLRERAEQHQATARSSLKVSAEYWRHIGALAFLQDTQKAMDAYEKAVALDPDEPEGWRYLGELQHRRGDATGAEHSFEQVLALGKSNNDPRTKSMGCLRLGWVARDGGELAKAEALGADALRFAQLAGWREGVARISIHLGNVHSIRGDFDKAEQAIRHALELFEDLGSEEGLALAYGNLGNVQGRRGELDQAMEAQRKALAIFEKLNAMEGVARTYANLGGIHAPRGELDEAEQVFRKALVLFEELGSKAGVARTCDNLGVLYQAQGKLGKAEEVQQRALALSEELDSKEGMSSIYNNLGRNYMARGHLRKAEEMLRKALAVAKDLGRKEGMANAEYNLGLVHQRRNDKAAMCKCWRQSRDLFREMGLTQEARHVEALLEQNKCGRA